MKSGSQAPNSGSSGQRRPEIDAGQRPPRIELSDAAHELVSIVGFVTADDGPLHATSEPRTLSSWQQQALHAALERLEVIDHYLRGRVAFFVAGKDHGYGPFGGEAELADAALDACRALVRVVDALLAERPPTEAEVDTMCESSVRLHPALDALEDGGG